MRENNKKDEKDKKSRRGIAYIVAYFFPIIAATFVVIINAILLYRGSKTDSLESNLISIFGIAVSVWVGLNIANAIDREKIINMQEKLDTFDGEIKEIEEVMLINSDAAKKSLIDYMRGDFELPISRWLAEQIEGMSTQTSELYRAIIDEEQLYRRIRQMARTQSFTSKNINILTDAESEHTKVIERIKKSLAKDDNKQILGLMMAIRETEVHFLIGYKLKDKNEKLKRFQKSIRVYEDAADMLIIGNYYISKALGENYNLVQFEKDIQGIDEKDIEIIAYILNFIGESYSMMTYISGTSKEYKELAKKLCHFTVVAASKCGRERETYYRNYGCAIERPVKGATEDDLKMALDQYERAYALDQKESRILHCLTSAYDKIFRILSGLNVRGKENITKFRIIDESKREKINEYLIRQRLFQNMYTKCFPEKKEAYIMSALYYRDQYVIDRRLSEDDLSKLVECLKIFEVFNVEKEAWEDGIEICKEAVSRTSGNIRLEIEALLQRADAKSRQG